MSKTSKITIGVIIVIIAVIVWFLMAGKNPVSVQPTSSAPAPQNAPAPASTSSEGLSTSPTDTSNAALNQDLTSIDAQLNGLASDSANIDQGLNDQPVSQGQ
jgi:hypothetical protein